MAEEREAPPELAAWVQELAYEFDLDEAQVPIGEILALASVTAHGVTRPAAPVSAFVAGLVAGLDGAAPAAITEALDAVRSLVADREPGGD